MNELQKELFNNGTYKAVMEEKRQLYEDGKLFDISKATKYGNVIDTKAFTCTSEEEVKECLKIRDNRRNRARRIRNRIVYWANMRKKTVKTEFVTFTFTDKTLETTERSTRVQYIRRKLSELCLDYIGNVDFGGKNGREHYHFVTMTDLETDLYKELAKLRELGAIYIEPFRNNGFSLKTIANYTDKLTNHALKTAGNMNIIAKRGTDYHRFEELGQYLGQRINFINCFEELEPLKREYAELTDFPAWVKHNKLYGCLDYDYFYKHGDPDEADNELMDIIEELGELFGENYEIEYDGFTADGWGNKTITEEE